MDKSEALDILRAQLARYRSQTHSELCALISAPHTFAVRGASGVSYNLEIQAFWDAQPDGDLRVIGCIDDGGLRFLAPLSEDFIIAPDDTFVGE